MGVVISPDRDARLVISIRYISSTSSKQRASATATPTCRLGACISTPAPPAAIRLRLLILASRWPSLPHSIHRNLSTLTQQLLCYCIVGRRKGIATSCALPCSLLGATHSSSKEAPLLFPRHGSAINSAEPTNKAKPKQSKESHVCAILHRPGALGLADPPAHYPPILAHHALHHRRPPLQLPVAAAATPLRLF